MTRFEIAVVVLGLFILYVLYVLSKLYDEVVEFNQGLKHLTECLIADLGCYRKTLERQAEQYQSQLEDWERRWEERRKAEGE